MLNQTRNENELKDFLNFVREADGGLRGPHPAGWLDQLEAEHEKLNSVLRGCIANGQIEQGIDIAGAVWPFWLHRAHIAEGREWLATLLADTRATAASQGRARALTGAGNLAFFQADYETAMRLMQESLGIFERLGIDEGIAEANSGVSRIAMAQGRPDLMRRHSMAALAIARSQDNAALSAIPLHHLAHAALMDGDLAEADRLYAANIETYRGMGRDDLVITELHNLGHVASLRGQPERAKGLFIESLRRGEESGNEANRPYNLIGLGRVALAEGQPKNAAVLLNAGLGILKKQGKAVVPLLRDAVEQAVADTKAEIGEAAFVATAAEGGALTTDEAVRMAGEKAD